MHRFPTICNCPLAHCIMVVELGESAAGTTALGETARSLVRQPVSTKVGLRSIFRHAVVSHMG